MLIEETAFVKEETILHAPSQCEAGRTAVVTMQGRNASDAALKRTTVTFELPKGTSYSDGSATLNGRVVANARAAYAPTKWTCSIEVGSLKPGDPFEVGIAFFVQSPCDDGVIVPVSAEVVSEHDRRALGATVAVVSQPEFSADRSYVEFEGVAVSAGRQAYATFNLMNDGTMTAKDPVLSFTGDNGLVLRAPGDGLSEMKLPDLEPGAAMTVQVEVGVYGSVTGTSSGSIGGSLAFTAGAHQRRAYTFPSAPVRISDPPILNGKGSAVARPGVQSVRLNEPFAVEVVVCNSGGDVAIQSAVDLNLPQGISPVGNSGTILLGDIPVGESVRRIVMLAASNVEGMSVIRPLVSCEGSPNAELGYLSVSVAKEVSFSMTDLVVGTPEHPPAAFSNFPVRFEFWNDGNVAADHAVVKLVNPSETTYVPKSLKANGHIVEGDDRFESDGEVRLHNVDRGAVVALSYELKAERPTSRAAEAIIVANVDWGLGRFSAPSAPFKIVPVACLGVPVGELPFQVDGLGADSSVTESEEIAMATPAMNAKIAPAQKQAPKSAPLRVDAIGQEVATPAVIAEATTQSPLIELAQTSAPKAAPVASASAPVVEEPLVAPVTVAETVSPPVAPVVEAPSALATVATAVETVPVASLAEARETKALSARADAASIVALTPAHAKLAYGSFSEFFGTDANSSAQHRLGAHVGAMISLLAPPNDQSSATYKPAYDSLRALHKELIMSWDAKEGVPDPESIKSQEVLDAITPLANERFNAPSHAAVLETYPSFFEGKPSFYGALAAMMDLIEAYDLTTLGMAVAAYREAILMSFVNIDDFSVTDAPLVFNEPGVDMMDESARVLHLLLLELVEQVA